MKNLLEHETWSCLRSRGLDVFMLWASLLCMSVLHSKPPLNFISESNIKYDWGFVTVSLLPSGQFARPSIIECTYSEEYPIAFLNHPCTPLFSMMAANAFTVSTSSSPRTLSPNS